MFRFWKQSCGIFKKIRGKGPAPSARRAFLGGPPQGGRVFFRRLTQKFDLFLRQQISNLSRMKSVYEPIQSLKLS